MTVTGTRGVPAGTMLRKTPPASLQKSGNSVEDAPMVATYVAELAETGRVSTGVFHTLFAGKMGHPPMVRGCAEAIGSKNENRHTTGIVVFNGNSWSDLRAARHAQENWRE
jgi:hypothetical protein